MFGRLFLYRLASMYGIVIHIFCRALYICCGGCAPNDSVRKCAASASVSCLMTFATIAASVMLLSIVCTASNIALARAVSQTGDGWVPCWFWVAAIIGIVQWSACSGLLKKWCGVLLSGNSVPGMSARPFLFSTIVLPAFASSPRLLIGIATSLLGREKLWKFAAIPGKATFGSAVAMACVLFPNRSGLGGPCAVAVVPWMRSASALLVTLTCDPESAMVSMKLWCGAVSLVVWLSFR